jgi:hypothetical protein
VVVRIFPAIVLIVLVGLAASEFAAAPCARTTSQQDVWVTTKIDALVRAARAAYENQSGHRGYEKVLDAIAGTMKQCRLSDNRDFATRYPEFIEYIEALSLERLDDHELGFIVSDRAYFAETQKFVTIPDFLLTPRFLKTVTRFETLAQAKALLREMNASRAPDDQLIFFSYESRHLGTPDNNDSFRRLLIVVPGNAAQHVPEKWVQFGITDPRARVRTRNVSVVGVVPGPDNTTNTYFKDYFRSYRRNGSITIKGRWELGYGDDNCVQCHKSGVLPIFPVDGSVSRDEQPFVEAVNDRFLTYGPPRFDKYLDNGKFGPGLGSIRAATYSGPVTMVKESHRSFPSRVNASTTANTACGSCHHSEGLGSLNWPMDSKLISSFVKGGRMPLGAELTKRERGKLYNQLIQEYFSIDAAHPGILKAWLLGKSR